MYVDLEVIPEKSETFAKRPEIEIVIYIFCCIEIATPINSIPGVCVCVCLYFSLSYNLTF